MSESLKLNGSTCCCLQQTNKKTKHHDEKIHKTKQHEQIANWKNNLIKILANFKAL
jgi:hypothetical protein